MQSAVGSTICRTVHSLPRPSLLGLPTTASPAPRLRALRPGSVCTPATTPMVVVTTSVLPRWTFHHRGPTSSPCTGVFKPLLSLACWLFCYEPSVIHQWNKMKWFVECNEQAVLRSRSDGDVKFTIGSEWYPSLIIVSTTAPLYSDYRSQITSFWLY